jgi:hypothetical protein
MSMTVSACRPECRLALRKKGKARTYRRVSVQLSEDRIQRKRNISDLLRRVDRDRLPVLGYSWDPATSYFPRLDSSSGLFR